jgi:hypothetical protein
VVLVWHVNPSVIAIRSGIFDEALHGGALVGGCKREGLAAYAGVVGEPNTPRTVEGAPSVLRRMGKRIVDRGAFISRVRRVETRSLLKVVPEPAARVKLESTVAFAVVTERIAQTFRLRHSHGNIRVDAVLGRGVLNIWDQRARVLRRTCVSRGLRRRVSLCNVNPTAIGTVCPAG